MHIHALLCAAATLAVIHSVPIAITPSHGEDDGIISSTNETREQNRADFGAVKARISKRQVHVLQPMPAGGGNLVPVGVRGNDWEAGVGPVIGPSGVNGVGAGFRTSFCLYGDDFVLLQDGSRKHLKNLRSGDRVYSVDKQGKLVKDEIIMMLHGGPNVEAPFYTLTTSSNRTVSLTGQHLIIKYIPQEKRSKMVAANELKVGDYLLMSDKQHSEAVSITSIELLYKTGIYTPMTYTGTLLINDIAVSCYVKYYNTYNELHTLLYPFRLYYYLIKDVLRLSEEPFSSNMQVSSLEYADNEFYGTPLIRWLHQSKHIIKFVTQDLAINTFLSI